MSIRRFCFAFLLLTVFAVPASADYLVVHRPAVVYSAPNRNSEEVFRPEVGTTLALRNDVQTDGYYEVETPTGQPGWIYRTLVRRYQGNPPDTQPAAQPSTGGAEAPAVKMTKSQCLDRYQGSAIEDCPRYGCSGDSELNKAKNRTDLAQNQTAQDWTLSQIIGLNEETPERWRRGSRRDELQGLAEGTPVSVSGFLVNAHLTRTPESCNCYIKGEESNDYHLNLVSRSGEGNGDSVVAEITPRYRPAGWDLNKLRRLANDSRYVRVTGWLLYDSMHTGQSEHRATAWEIHPVTRFQVCTTTKNACDQGQGWRELDNF